MGTQKMKMSSSNENKSTPSFCKILADKTANNLLLPPAFMKMLLLEPKFPQRPELETHCGKKWQVKIEKNGKKFYFGKGWIEFVKDTKTEAGDFLAFWLTFKVSIFGSNGCEKNLTSAVPSASYGRSKNTNADFSNVIQIDDDEEYGDHNDDEDCNENENSNDYEEEDDGANDDDDENNDDTDDNHH